MRKILCVIAVISCLMLCACEAASIGIIGGADGPTAVYVD